MGWDVVMGRSGLGRVGAGLGWGEFSWDVSRSNVPVHPHYIPTSFPPHRPTLHHLTGMPSTAPVHAYVRYRFVLGA